MKISNSKKQLAKIISENGGWREGALWSVQHGNGRVVFTNMGGKPIFDGCWDGYGTFRDGFVTGKALPNWHQTIVSRDEYFHLYPAQDAISPMDFGVVDDFGRRYGSKPTIEQLAADYRAKLANAQQAQEEADSHRCGAEAALEKLVAAGKALGLSIGVAIK